MKRQSPKRSRRLPAVVLAAILVACTPMTIERLSSADDLMNMLRDAGAEVDASPEPVPAAFDARRGSAVQVDESVVYVYEYGSADEVEAVAARIGPEGAGLTGAGTPWAGRVSAWPAGRLLVIYPGTDGGLILLLSGLMGDPLTAAPEGPEEPYPPAIAAAIAAWAEAQGLDPAAVEVVGYTAARWMNGCLGLPEPGESCAAGEVSGWVVELRAGDRSGVAHTDDLGLHVRLMPPA